MSKWDKLLSRVHKLSKDLKFREVCKIMDSYGYEMKGSSGGSSHYTFRKSGCAPITIPKDEPVKIVYIKMIRDIILNEEANQHEND